jgi:hypothetical protein
MKITLADLDTSTSTLAIREKVLRVSRSPIMDVGSHGTFDEHGVVPSCVIQAKDSSLLMYYSGFERFDSVPYKIFTGLAISTDNG